MAFKDLKPRYKAILIGGGSLLAVFALQQAFVHGVIPTPALFKSIVPEKTANINGAVVADKPAQNYDLAPTPAGAPAQPVRLLTIPWNGVAPTTLANGGVTTTPDSLFAKYTGGTLSIEAQSDYSVIKTELATGRAQAAQIMGDGWPAFIATLNDKTKEEFVVVYITGFSYGEDKCMGPPAAKGNPQAAKGILIAAVPYDGDWNSCVKWASDNGIKVNTDQTTYDPDAMNFVDTMSFEEADNKYISGASETRDEVRDGKKTGKKVTKVIDGVATWTPGDVAVVKQKGGVVSLADTRDYNQQMPAVLIVNKKWAEQNRQFVVNWIKALDRAAFQIRNGDKSFGATQAAVFGRAGGPESKADYWTKYYVGYDDQDAFGNKVRLGGSRAVTASEVRQYLGMVPGSLNVYKSVYDIFGGYARTYYPKDVPAIPKFEDVVDTSYLADALRGVNIGAPAPSQFATKQSITEARSNRSYYINFATGSANIVGAQSTKELFELAGQAGMTSFRIRIDGHTDNTGNSATNVALSRARAQAVADWLKAQAPDTFPDNRLEVRGYGDSMPLADNATEAGRAKNRRVEITLGN